MRDTYETGAEADADRKQQERLLAALNASSGALRRDECGAWAINGTDGVIHTYGDNATWLLCARCRSPQHWTWTVKGLPFCTVTQAGDDEGCLRLHALPTPSQAEAIRGALGIRKRREVSEAELARLKAHGFAAKGHGWLQNLRKQAS